METTHTNDLIAEAKKYSYAEYKAVADEQIMEGMTANPHLLEYTKLNVQRMKRLDKTTELRPELAAVLQKLSRKLTWIVLSEGWCGDASQNVPVLAKIAEASDGKINLQLVFRDHNLELMDQYLTNGSRSIPKLICLDAATQTELGTWGPRPAEAQQLFQQLKAEGVPKPDILTAIHNWYAKDKTQTMQLEMTNLLAGWNR